MGSKQASLYLQPPGSTPNNSHAAKPHVSICTVIKVKAIPIMPKPKTIREKKTLNPADWSTAAASKGDNLLGSIVLGS